LKAPERPKGTPHGGRHPEGHTQRAHGKQARGRVHLVGAGPGDPGLLTARALELIASADTILYDRLIPAQALDGVRADAELLFVGKQRGGASIPQEQTQALMIERARAGREVVRLKGGDPFVFGRGGEEALALRDAGIDFGVVPGVTAGIAAAAYAGIPVTHRGLSTGVALITGHTDLNWRALAAFPGTLVFYMGVCQLPRIAAELIAAGRPESQPVAVVERGTLPDQRTLTGTLATIAEVASREQVKAPAITIVGAVAGLAGSLEWLPTRPLAGRTVAVTRARAQTSRLAQRLGELGATVVQAPSIRTQAISDPILPPLDPARYDLICLTSPNGVEFLFERLAAGGHDARSLANTRIAAIGPGTARALGEHGIVADVVPERFVAESLVEALVDVDVRRALVARASEARDVLPDALRARGAEVDVLALYETVAEPLSESALEQARAADYVTFTSSSTVRYFLQAARGVGERGDDSGAAGGSEGEQDGDSRVAGPVAMGAVLSPTTRIVSIGPVTSATLREHGLEPHVEAQRHDIDGLVDALLADTLTPPE
jgi:uroporphyrinogen III methyltransferase/synthase